MDDHPASTDSTVDPAKFTTLYIRRLLAEREYIMARIHNQGGSVILTATSRVDADRDRDYSGAIGNPFHLDIIELDGWLDSLGKGERDALILWGSGLSTQQAAVYLNVKGSLASIRKRRQRGIEKITEEANDTTDTNTATSAGRSGRYTAPEPRLTARDLDTPTWDFKRTA